MQTALDKPEASRKELPFFRRSRGRLKDCWKLLDPSRFRVCLTALMVSYRDDLLRSVCIGIGQRLDIDGVNGSFASSEFSVGSERPMK